MRNMFCNCHVIAVGNRTWSVSCGTRLPCHLVDLDADEMYFQFGRLWQLYGLPGGQPECGILLCKATCRRVVAVLWFLYKAALLDIT